jgi:hypothetical protein
MVLPSSFVGMLMYTCNWKVELGGRTHNEKLGIFGLVATKMKNVRSALRKDPDYKERERFEFIMIW